MKLQLLSAGQRFGKLVIVNPIIIGYKRPHVLVKCDCGKEKIVQKAHLICGDTTSCGCFRKAKMKLNSAHVDSRCSHPLYVIYSGMLARCYNIKCKNYVNYGARGIKVCEEWKNDFWKFVQDMSERPSQNHSIERMDNNGPYSKQNCCWATYKEQATNRRPCIPSKVLGTQTAVTEAVQ